MIFHRCWTSVLMLIGLFILSSCASTSRTSVSNTNPAPDGLKPLSDSLKKESIGNADSLSPAVEQGLPPPSHRQAYKPEMISIEGGCYQIGSPENEKGRDDDERRSRVCVKDFWIGKYEVSNAEYRRFNWNHDSKAYKGHSLNGERQPAVYLSWEDAMAYAQWLSEKTGQRYRLPTEAEWEYAARAGSRAARYWGKNPDEACRYANAADRAAKREWSDWTVHHCDDGHAVTAAVGSFRANAYGLYDMLGNVWEWTCSVYEKNYNGAEQRCAKARDIGSNRVFRGGSWGNIPRFVRTANRSHTVPGDRTGRLGFRLVRK